MIQVLVRYLFIALITTVTASYSVSFNETSLIVEEVAPAGKNLLHTKNLIKQQLVTIARELKSLTDQRWKSFERKEPPAQDLIDKISALRLDQDDLQNQLVIIDNTLQYNDQYEPSS